MSERTIRVTGKGKLSVKPDTIRISINASEVCKEYEEAVRRSASQTGVLREAVKGAGLDPKSLRTTSFGIDTEYDSFRDRKGEYKREFIGYRYTHRLYFTFPNDNELLGKVLYELANCSAEAEFSLMHTVKDPEAVKEQLKDVLTVVSVIGAQKELVRQLESYGLVRDVDYLLYKDFMQLCRMRETLTLLEMEYV